MRLSADSIVGPWLLCSCQRRRACCAPSANLRSTVVCLSVWVWVCDGGAQHIACKAHQRCDAGVGRWCEEHGGAAGADARAGPVCGGVSGRREDRHPCDRPCGECPTAPIRLQKVGRAVCVCVCVCVCVRVRACVRACACVSACARAPPGEGSTGGEYRSTGMEGLGPPGGSRLCCALLGDRVFAHGDAHSQLRRAAGGQALWHSTAGAQHTHNNH